MQFTHEVSLTAEAPLRDVWAHWADIHVLPRHLSHIRATAAGHADDLARLVIILDGRHLEFAVERTMCADHTLCWQSLGETFLYVLTVSLEPDGHRQTCLTLTVAYDPPGFLPDIAESLGLSKQFKRTLETDLHHYAAALRDPSQVCDTDQARELVMQSR